MNLYVGCLYEDGSTREREKVIENLGPALIYGVDAALQDCTTARENGFERAPRIRFSHIGDMASTPEFTNRLAWEIRHRAPEIECVAYTRHSNADRLDPQNLIVNFTVESADDPRFKWIPSHARIVGSAWDGHVVQQASVNFLEHHVEKSASSVGNGHICPVTDKHEQLRSCDEARCDLCFQNPANINQGSATLVSVIGTSSVNATTDLSRPRKLGRNSTTEVRRI